jgi:hypothetical protein
MKARDAQAQPWYREPWPWILMSGPAVVVVAGFFTAWLAVRSDDGLVVDDYYKQGLAINQTLGRSDAARRLGVQAELRLVDGRISVFLGNTAVRGSLNLRLVHPTRSGMDQSIAMDAVRPGTYEGQLHALLPGRWHVVLEERDWRLAGDWILPATGALLLGTRAQAPEDGGKPKEGNQ